MDRDDVIFDSGSLRVRFQRIADRFAHTIEFKSANLPLLASVEGSDADPWPISPPFQQVVAESVGLPSRPVLLGVGLAGNGHWSIAIESIEPEMIKFDIACKVSKPSKHLGTRYRFCDGVTVVPIPHNGRVIAFAMHAQGPTERRGAIEVERGTLQLSSCGKFVELGPQTDSETIGTHRWTYRLSLA